MRSYIKIYGPPILETLRALEKVGVDTPEVCIMDINIELQSAIDPFQEDERVQQYFMSNDVGALSVERCSTIISKSGQKTGEFDFFFEWFDPKGPSPGMLNELIKKVDTALTPLGCKYTITTK